VYRSFTINGGMPKVEVHDPLQAHIDMLPTLKDGDIHNLTAYLVTVR
jgi:cytochrome c oxidase cbb3-type subunit 3